MPDVGVKELKTHVSEIVRNVRERRARYIITYRGRPVGILAPLEATPESEALSGEEGPPAWEELTRLGEEIGQGWKSPLSAAELLSGMRR
ncbi:MAG: type II toxin-antitoxin system Phd/YefM family antitoxin [Anaerolineae bacterium]